MGRKKEIYRDVRFFHVALQLLYAHQKMVVCEKIQSIKNVTIQQLKYALRISFNNSKCTQTIV